MSELMHASRQWASRPSDERYTSLTDMASFFVAQRAASKAVTVSSRSIKLEPGETSADLRLISPNGHACAPSNWAFGQLAALSESPAGYLKTLPSPLVADCLNYGLQFKRDIEDVGLLLYKNGDSIVRAATGPRYGRIWNRDIVNGLINRFGDGVTGDWRVPGEFGKKVAVTKDNTTLFAGDRDMFVFLADEDHRIEMKNRRAGASGSLARGFFMWNSEVGSSTFGLGTFLFDYACSNRIVWGAEQYKEIRIRHTASAPDRFIDEIAPALNTYALSSTKTIEDTIREAQSRKIEKVDEFLAGRFGKGLVSRMITVHALEEGRPIETVWDAATAATAYAKRVNYQNERVEIERKAGQLLDLVAA